MLVKQGMDPQRNKNHERKRKIQSQGDQEDY
jgi:hypothetical protein